MSQRQKCHQPINGDVARVKVQMKKQNEMILQFIWFCRTICRSWYEQKKMRQVAKPRRICRCRCRVVLGIKAPLGRFPL